MRWLVQAASWRERLHRAARGPGFLLSALLLALVAVALATGLLSGLRTLYAAPPYQDPDRLVVCYQVHFLSASWGVQARHVRPWQDNSKLLSGLAAYQVRVFRLAAPGLPEQSVAGARVTPGFFSLLGVQPRLGRSFQPQDTFTRPPVLLSDEIWRRRFGSNPNVAGTEVTLDGQVCQVVGVLPPNFWFRSRKLAVWTLLPDQTRSDPATRLVGTVGRLRPGATASAVRAELENIVRRTSRFRGGAIRVVPLAQSLRPSLQSVFSGFGVGMLLAVGLAVVQCWRSWRKRPGSMGELCRYWVFFSAKVGLFLTVLAVLFSEAAARNAMGLHSFKLLVSLSIDWASILGAMLIFRWSVLDQSRRCPVCLRRLGITASSGSWSSALLEPPSTELLCDQGHGELRIADSGTALGEIRRWIALEDSWREHFTTERDRY